MGSGSARVESIEETRTCLDYFYVECCFVCVALSVYGSDADDLLVKAQQLQPLADHDDTGAGAIGATVHG